MTELRETSPNRRLFAGRVPGAGWTVTELVGFWLALLGSLALLILTPPFETPDEHQHFFRAYQLSELTLTSEVRAGEAGAELPSSLPESAERFLLSREEHIDRPIILHPIDRTLEEFGRPLDPERREWVRFVGSSLYPPLPYVPQATAISLGRALGGGPAALLYLGRLANLLVGLAIFLWALSLAPAGWRPAFFVGVLPMSLILYASNGPDALIFTSAFLFTATVLRTLTPSRWRTRDVIVAIVCGIVFCSAKPTYAPLLLAGFAGALNREHRRNVLAANAIIVVAVVAATFLWLQAQTSVRIPVREGVDFAAQVAFLKGNPIDYAQTLVRTNARYLPFYYQGFIGIGGWLNVYPPKLLYLIGLVALGASLAGNRPAPPRLSPFAILWLLALIAASVLLVFTALYIYWNPVGASEVEGVQGRYFLPLAPLAFALLYGLVPPLPERYRPAFLPLLAIGSLVALATIMIVVVVWTYQVF